MQIHEGIANLPTIRNAVVTSGTFDGVHIGHQKIIENLLNIAQSIDGETVLLTFWPHPRLILHPEESNLRLLSSFEEKADLLEQQGIDHLIKIPFTKEFSQLTSDEFIRKIIVEAVNTKKLVIGYDHRFGKNREGSFEYLKANADKYGLQVMEIPPQDVDDVTVSSTKIRNAVFAGEVKVAADLLGRNYSLQGTVMHGDRLGRTIGFPTANIHIPEPYKLIPALGAYAVKVIYKGNVYKGMMNIGYRPTVKGADLRIEAHIFDFNEEIYGETLKIELVEMIREEIKFESLDKLQTQLKADQQAALTLLV